MTGGGPWPPGHVSRRLSGGWPTASNYGRREGSSVIEAVRRGNGDQARRCGHWQPGQAQPVVVWPRARPAATAAAWWWWRFPVARPFHEHTQGTEECEGDVVTHIARTEKALRARNVTAASLAPTSVAVACSGDLELGRV
jgi:hypothetical protein